LSLCPTIFSVHLENEIDRREYAVDIFLNRATKDATCKYLSDAGSLSDASMMVMHRLIKPCPALVVMWIPWGSS
jgi:hypothetical protein